MRRPSSYDIARHLGVSQTTVSFVLSGRSDTAISDATRQRVLQAARELGYRPNRSARSMQSGRFGSIALLLSTVVHRSVLTEDLRQGILDALDSRNLHLILNRLPDETLTDSKFVPTILREWAADGVLINYNADVPEAMGQLFKENALPVLWLNAKRDADCVHPDDYGAARSGVRAFVECGHQRIAYIGYTGVTHYSAADRERGYRDEMQAHGLEPHVIYPQEGAGCLSHSECKMLLSTSARPTAYLCYATSSVFRLMFVAVQQGFRVPHDLSLMTFSNRVDTSMGISITSMGLPEYEMGRVGVELLLEKIEHPLTLLEPRALAVPLLNGETLAAAP